MRDLTIHELEAQMAEQLPARELMGHCGNRGGNSTRVNVGSYDGNGNGNGDNNFGLIAIQADGDGNGNFDGLGL
jgi:hypothetical protein